MPVLNRLIMGRNENYRIKETQNKQTEDAKFILRLTTCQHGRDFFCYKKEGTFAAYFLSQLSTNFSGILLGIIIMNSIRFFFFEISYAISLKAYEFPIEMFNVNTDENYELQLHTRSFKQILRKLA